MKLTVFGSDDHIPLPNILEQSDSAFMLGGDPCDPKDELVDNGENASGEWKPFDEPRPESM